MRRPSQTGFYAYAAGNSRTLLFFGSCVQPRDLYCSVFVQATGRGLSAGVVVQERMWIGFRHQLRQEVVSFARRIPTLRWIAARTEAERAGAGEI